MRKLIVLMVMLVVIASSASANAMLMYPPEPYSSPGDYYKVQFDGEGEASVMARLTKLNTGKEDLREIVLEIPGKYVELKYVFQEVSWGNYKPLDYTTEHLSKSTKYTIKLHWGIEPGQTGTILLSYKAMGYVNRFVNYDFDFETIKTGMDIGFTRVAVSVDPDLYLRGGETWVDYRSDFSGFGMAAQGVMEIGGGQSETLRSYSDNILYASGHIRTKSNLDPWESFHVTGSYNWANLWFLTYIWEIAGAIVVLAVLKLLFFRRIKVFRWRLPRDRFSRTVGVGFVTAAALLLVWWGVVSLMGAATRWFYWFAPLLFLVSGTTIILVLLAPAYAVGRKHGFQQGIWTLVSTILWMFVLLAVMAVLSIGAAPPIYLALG